MKKENAGRDNLTFSHSDSGCHSERSEVEIITY